MSRRAVDSEVIRNLFARAYAETKDIADAFWVVEGIIRKKTTVDVGAVGINRMVEEAAAFHGLEPKSILGIGRAQPVCAARFEIWWRLRQRTPPLSYPAIGAAFGRDHTCVMRGVRIFSEWLANSAELRARMTWQEAEWNRAA